MLTNKRIAIICEAIIILTIVFVALWDRYRLIELIASKIQSMPAVTIGLLIFISIFSLVTFDVFLKQIASAISRKRILKRVPVSAYYHESRSEVPRIEHRIEHRNDQPGQM